MKKFFLLTVILAFFGLTASAQPSGLLGTWKSTTMQVLSDGQELMSMNCDVAGMLMEFTFKSDGTVNGVIVTEDGRDESPSMTYTVSGQNVYVTDEDGEEVVFKYSGVKLALTMQEDGMDIRVTFEKK